MKKALVILFVISACFAHAQNDYDLPTQGTRFTMLNNDQNMLTVEWQDSVDFQGTWYRKVHDASLQPNGCCYSLIRQEGTKWFLWNNFDNLTVPDQEFPYFDWSANVGDTLTTSAWDSATLTVQSKVDSIVDFPLLDGDTRRLYYLSEVNPESEVVSYSQMLEGFGQINHFWKSAGNLFTTGSPNDALIICIEQDDVTLFENPNRPFLPNYTDCMWDPVSIENFAHQPDVVIYPNPASTLLTVQTPDSWNDGFSVRLIDVFGKELIIAKAKTNTTRLNISALPEGIYIVETIKNAQTAEKHRILVKR